MEEKKERKKERSTHHGNVKMKVPNYQKERRELRNGEKGQLCADFPDPISFPGCPEKVETRLRLVEQFVVLWRSMPSRVRQPLMRRDDAPATSNCAGKNI